ncbi:hypothetical protein BJ166DRAFT_231476 [Pestalotiopsis sp. NC0098]|nr:hypothetical protein BJ166DRAFT_231476 [Pestalotiopsis sp. NC0098]
MNLLLLARWQEAQPTSPVSFDVRGSPSLSSECYCESLGLVSEQGVAPASIPLRKTLLSQPSAPGPTQPRRRRPGEAFLKTRLDRGNGALTYHLKSSRPCRCNTFVCTFLKNNRQTHIEISRFGLYSRFAHHGETGSCRMVRVPVQQPTKKALLPSTRDMCLVAGPSWQGEGEQRRRGASGDGRAAVRNPHSFMFISPRRLSLKSFFSLLDSRL